MKLDKLKFGRAPKGWRLRGTFKTNYGSFGVKYRHPTSDAKLEIEKMSRGYKVVVEEPGEFSRPKTFTVSSLKSAKRLAKSKMKEIDDAFEEPDMSRFWMKPRSTTTLELK